MPSTNSASGADDWSLPLYFVAWVATFSLWNYQLFRGRPGIPIRTVVLLLAVQLLNWWWLAFVDWRPHRRPTFVAAVYGINAASLVLLATGWVFLRSSPRFLPSLAFHWAGWLWLTVDAFPGPCD